MAPGIDWGQLSPLQGPAPEIASISNLLGAIAENRQKQQQAAAEREFRERQFAAQQANVQADNERAQQEIALRRQQEERNAAAAKAKAEQDRAKAFNKGLPGVQGALRNDDLQGARMVAEPLGGDVVEDYAHKESGEAAQQERGQRVADSLAPVSGLGAMQWLFPEQVAMGAQAQAQQPTGAEAASKYQIHGPAGKVLDYSPFDQRQAEQRAAAEARQRVEAAAGGLQLPHGQRIAPVAGALAELGEKPDEALAKGIAGAQTAEIQGNTDRRSMRAAALAKTIKPGQAADDARADTSAFSQDYARWEKNTNVDKTTDDFTKFGQMAEHADAFGQTGNTVDQRAVLYNAARLITGPGVLTAQEYSNTVTRTKGIAGELMTKISKGLTGKISDAEWDIVNEFVQNAKGAIRQRAIGHVKNFDRKYGAKSRYTRTAPDDVAGTREALVDRFGLTPGDLGEDIKALNAEADSLLGGGR